ncbi:MAG: hypothetical protein FWC43_07955 [Planctomycetaceae bacterium]|nr:hypothetical protein [Planctomycetaceae bacterium]
MKYAFSLLILLFFAAASHFSITLAADLLVLPDDNEPGVFESPDSPYTPSPQLQPQSPSAAPLQRPTTSIGLPQTDSAETPQVRPTMRSQTDADHPFSQLQFDVIDPNSKITGKPLTICEMLESVSSPQTRCQLLHAYWALAGELAKYKIARTKQAQLTQWGGKYGAIGAKSAVFQAAEKQAIAQRQSSELHVILKQTELAALLKQTSGYYKPIVQANQTATEQLPIPCDLPFIGVYQTHVNRLVQYRPASNLVLLDKTIAIRRQIFETKCEEFNATAELFNAILNSEPSVEALIQTTNQYYATHGECIDAIIAYNEVIAEYVALTVGPEITGRRLLKTLIQLNPEPNQSSEVSEPTENPADSVPVVERGYAF